MFRLETLIKQVASDLSLELPDLHSLLFTYSGIGKMVAKISSNWIVDEEADLRSLAIII